MTATRSSTTHLLTDLTSKEEDRYKSSESMEDGFSPKVEGATIAKSDVIEKERRLGSSLILLGKPSQQALFHRVIEESNIFR